MAVLSAGALAPAAACADPLFDNFHAICLTTESPAAAIAAADAKGWRPMPKAELARFPIAASGGPDVTLDGRIDGTIGTATSLKWAAVSGHASKIDEVLNIGADFCVVAGRPAEMAALRAELADYAGVPANPNLFKKPEILAFAWREGSGGRAPLSEADLERPDLAADINVLVAQDLGGLAMVGRFKPTK